MSDEELLQVDESAQDSVEGEPEGGTPEVVQITREDLDAAIADSAAASAVDVSQMVADAMGDYVSENSVVELVPEQYEQMREIMASDLHTSVFMVGLGSLLLGAVVATALTLHWRAGRG